MARSRVIKKMRQKVDKRSRRSERRRVETVGGGGEEWFQGWVRGFLHVETLNGR